MKTDENKRIVLSFLEKIQAGKVDDCIAMMSDNSTYWVGGKPDKFPFAGTKTKMGFKEMLSSTLNTMPDGLKMTPLPSGITAEGDRVAIEVESYGRTDSGRVYNNLYHFVFVVREGKIDAVKEYLDTLHTKEIFVD
ncbi:MAG: nuclear transport factor 2 family protein [Georgfuchsia sp.]